MYKNIIPDLKFTFKDVGNVLIDRIHERVTVILCTFVNNGKEFIIQYNI